MKLACMILIVSVLFALNVRICPPLIAIAQIEVDGNTTSFPPLPNDIIPGKQKFNNNFASIAQFQSVKASYALQQSMTYMGGVIKHVFQPSSKEGSCSYLKNSDRYQKQLAASSTYISLHCMTLTDRTEEIFLLHCKYLATPKCSSDLHIIKSQPSYGPNLINFSESKATPSIEIYDHGDVPDMGVVERLATITVPPYMHQIRFDGFSAKGDGGGWPLAIEVPEDSSPLKPTQRRSNDGTRRWELRSDILDIRMFGASPSKNDNSKEINDALSAAVGKKLFIPPNRFITLDVLRGVDGVQIYGIKGFSELYSPDLPNGGVGYNVRQLQFEGVVGWSVRNILFNAENLVPSASMRNILVKNSSNFTIEDNDFRTPGAATAITRSSHYNITDNLVRVSSRTGQTYHDGIIDQWDGVHDFSILDNRVDGMNIGRYGVLVTGESSGGSAAPCYNYKIIGNFIQNVTSYGIWSNGRGGVNYSFVISKNNIEMVTKYHGIGISDSHDGIISYNVLKNIAGNGIRLYSEHMDRGKFGTSDITVNDNFVANVNLLKSRSSVDGAAFTALDSMKNVTFSDNKVEGTSHAVALYLGQETRNNIISSNDFAAGILSTIIDNGYQNAFKK